MKSSPRLCSLMRSLQSPRRTCPIIFDAQMPSIISVVSCWLVSCRQAPHCVAIGAVGALLTTLGCVVMSRSETAWGRQRVKPRPQVADAYPGLHSPAGTGSGEPEKSMRRRTDVIRAVQVFIDSEKTVRRVPASDKSNVKGDWQASAKASAEHMGVHKGIVRRC